MFVYYIVGMYTRVFYYIVGMHASLALQTTTIQQLPCPPRGTLPSPTRDINVHVFIVKRMQLRAIFDMSEDVITVGA